MNFVKQSHGLGSFWREARHKKGILVSVLVAGILSACTLSASQEQALNKQTGMYLNALENKSILSIVSMTHPSFVKHVKSKGQEYFKQVFGDTSEEELLYIDPKIDQIVEDKGEIHVLYVIEKEFIKHGENHETESKIVAISKDDGQHWFYLSYSVYRNTNICKDIPRLIH